MIFHDLDGIDLRSNSIYFNIRLLKSTLIFEGVELCINGLTSVKNYTTMASEAKVWTGFALFWAIDPTLLK